MNTDDYATGRKETFLIADNERFIGCEFDHGTNWVLGVTLLKWKISAWAKRTAEMKFIQK